MGGVSEGIGTISLKGTYLPSGGQSVANFWPIWDNLIIRERLDVIFVSNSLQDFITETGIIPPYKTCSDHGIPFIEIEGFLNNLLNLF